MCRCVIKKKKKKKKKKEYIYIYIYIHTHILWPLNNPFSCLFPNIYLDYLISD